MSAVLLPPRKNLRLVLREKDRRVALRLGKLKTADKVLWFQKLHGPVEGMHHQPYSRANAVSGVILFPQEDHGNSPKVTCIVALPFGATIKQLAKRVEL